VLVAETLMRSNNNKNPKQQGDFMSQIIWEIGGARGREIHGMLKDGGDDPVVIIRCGSSVWDFEVVGYDGSGRCRVGNGCAYNPLHMIEAVYHYVTGSISEPTFDGLEMNPNLAEWKMKMEDDWT
jgi:hypothetical protein